MKPVYFPYTYLPAAAADALRTLFPSVVVYQPVAGRMPDEMRPLAESGFFEVVAPVGGDGDDVDRLIREFQEWGHRHQGGTGLETARMQRSILEEPSGAEGSLYAIATQLKRRMSSELAAQTADTLLTARVFLQLGQAADQQRQQIAGELACCERSRVQLFDALKGGRDPDAYEYDPPGAASRRDDADDHIESRMLAWARLFLNHPYPSPVFVTPSIALIRHLAETIEGRQPVRLRDVAGEASYGSGLSPESTGLLLADLAAGRIALPEQRLTGLPTPCTDSLAEEAGIHVWLDVSPIAFFSRLFPAAAPMDDRPPAPVTWRHTIVVQIGGFAKTTSRLDRPI